MAAHQFTVEDDRYLDEPPVRKTNWLKGCLLGCLGVFVVLLVLGILATVYVARNWKSLVANTMSMAIKQSIDASELPAEEKAQVKVEIDRGAKLFAEGRLSQHQAEVLLEKAMTSPLITAMVTAAAETKYLARSGLSDEEKADARVTLPRFVRGMIDEKIDQEAQDAVLRHVGDRQPNGQWKFRDNLSDEDLRAFLAEAKKAADAAGVSDQPQAIDPSDEVRRIIDEAMAAPAVEAAPAPPPDIPPPAEEPHAEEPAAEEPPAEEPHAEEPPPAESES